MLPIRESIGVSKVRQEALNLVRYVRGFRNHLKYAPREFHNTQRMLEPLVRCPRVQKIRKGELGNVSETLKRPGVEHLLFIPIQVDEDVDWVSNLMKNLRHDAGSQVSIFVRHMSRK